MSGYQKHSIPSIYHLDTSNLTQPSLLVPVAKWTGGGGSSSTGSSATYSTGQAAGSSSSTLRGGLQSRSRNIDIPNSKPRTRPKHPPAAVSRVPSNVRSGLSSRKSNLSAASPAPLPVSSGLNWHTRPPRGGLASFHTTQNDIHALKSRNKKTLASRHEGKHFTSIEAPGSVEPTSWANGLAGGDEDAFTTVRVMEVSRDAPSAVVRATTVPRRKDAVEGLARALLSDCINKRNMEQFKAKKVINTSTVPQSAISSSFTSPKELESCRGMPLYDDGGGVLSCSSSDDELNQLYKLEPSFVWDDKCRVDGCLNKMCQDSTHGHDSMTVTSSPESDSYFEEKGLSKEIRYNLPIAYGTVNETEKHCTICQVPYEIGSHIVTLTPCHHFFHALCVDKWLWNHVTCPLCREEVVYNLDSDRPQIPVHVRGTECPDVDQETMRKKLRSQCAEFRPVKPLKPGWMSVLHLFAKPTLTHTYVM
ncbi:hypothetical protein, variant [Aphanomyces astaci]|uniref:RING-type domain-containing protein n=1 Tax=Aphanomyces astaci TaxID=112090 RepID=W4FUM0_APHAT|nr:hypothetical protein, variant [Aphanomyces astaci]ETV71187.1 hypothetical protein, variant [Aphanomyces astaci]|eukprot:XP_009839433.1 hypothetical protein, variant [Aphanomyces astaci]